MGFSPVRGPVMGHRIAPWEVEVVGIQPAPRRSWHRLGACGGREAAEGPRGMGVLPLPRQDSMTHWQRSTFKVEDGSRKADHEENRDHAISWRVAGVAEHWAPGGEGGRLYRQIAELLIYTF